MFARPIVVLLALTIMAGAARAQTTDPREIQAREAYAAGRYREAVDLFSKLYATTLHPTYLRNVGRCYQNLEEPQLAIKSYQEYLRKAPATPAERREVEGFIAEMEALKKVQAQPAAPPPTAATPAAPPAPAPRAPVMSSPSSSPPSAPSSPSSAPSSPPSVDLLGRGSQSEAPSSAFYARWWFWALLGVGLAGAAAAVLLTRGNAEPSTDYGPFSPTWQ